MMRSYAVAAVLVAVCLSESLVVAYSVRGSLRMSSKTPQTKKLLIPTATATDALLPRRVALQSLFSGALGIASAALGNHPAAAADIKRAAAADGLLEQVFFGVGCFWHIQHEFIAGERDILKRNEHEYTSLAGYAGGKSTDKEGRVCYHNIMQVADYGRLGHGEAVGIKLPSDKIVEFSELYFSLFNPKTKERVDPGDRGSEYRSIMGLPGGTQHPVYPGIEQVASKAGFKLVPGQGNDPDTLGKQIVYVYDTAKFPFYPGEVYHQYHDDFQNPPYGRAYNKLADLALVEGRIRPTGCPDRV